MLDIVITQSILGLIVFVLFWAAYSVTVLRKENKLDKLLKGAEAMVLKKLGKLDFEKHNKKDLAKTIIFINSFTIALVFAIVTTIENLIFSVLLGGVLMIVMILIAYSIAGKCLHKKEVKKDV